MSSVLQMIQERLGGNGSDSEDQPRQLPEPMDPAKVRLENVQYTLDLMENPEWKRTTDLIELVPLDGSGEPITAAIHLNGAPLVRAIYYTDSLSIILPAIPKDYPEYEDHQRRTRFGSPAFDLFLKATTNFVNYYATRKTARLAVMWAPLPRMTGKGQTARLHGLEVKREMYAGLLQSTLHDQTWHPQMITRKNTDPLLAGSPHSVKHTRYYTVVDGEWVYAYWSFPQIRLEDVERLLDTDLTIWCYFQKEYHPDQEPQGKKVRDFWALIIGRFRTPLHGAEEAIAQKSKELRYIRNIRRITGTEEVKRVFQKTIVGSSPPTPEQMLSWGAFRTLQKPRDNWQNLLNRLTSRNDWRNITGPRNQTNGVNPLKTALVALGYDDNGNIVFGNWYEKNIIAAQESKSGKSAYLLWQMFQWFGKNSLILHYTAVRDEAAQRLVRMFGGKIFTMPYNGDFIDSDDPKIQAAREMAVRKLAQEHHEKWLEYVLNTGEMWDFPMLLQPEHESQAFIHYLTMRASLLRASYSDLRAITPRAESPLPNIFAGDYMCAFHDNASYASVITPAPPPTVYYPWREIQNSVNQGTSGGTSTWVGLHNDEACPPGFINTFNVRLDVLIEKGLYRIRLTNPKEKKQLMPKFTCHFTSTMLGWVGRTEGKTEG